MRTLTLEKQMCHADHADLVQAHRIEPAPKGGCPGEPMDGQKGARPRAGLEDWQA